MVSDKLGPTTSMNCRIMWLSCDMQWSMWALWHSCWGWTRVLGVWMSACGWGVLLKLSSVPTLLLSRTQHWVRMSCHNLLLTNFTSPLSSLIHSLTHSPQRTSTSSLSQFSWPSHPPTSPYLTTFTSFLWQSRWMSPSQWATPSAAVWPYSTMTSWRRWRRSF